MNSVVAPDEAERGVSESIGRLIHATRNGSLQDLKSLVIAVRGLEPADVPAVLDALRYVLTTIAEIHDFDRAVTTSFTCLLGLDFISRSSDQPDVQSPFIDTLSDVWHPFSVWLFAAPDIDFFRKEPDERLPFLRSLRFALTVFSRLPPDRSPAISWPRLVRFSLHLWLKIEPVTAGELCILYDIFLLPPIGNLSYEDVVDVSNDNGMDVAMFLDFVIGRLKRYGRRLKTLSSSIDAPSELVHRLCGALLSTHFVLAGLLHSGSRSSSVTSAPELKDTFIRVVSISTMFMNVGLSTFSLRYRSVFRCVEFSLVVVAMLLDVLPDIRAIRVALRRGLVLFALAASSRSKDLTEAGNVALQNLVGRILPRNLVFLSVFLSVRRSLSSCRRTEGVRIVFSNGPELSTAWNYLFRLVDHSTHALAYFRKRQREGVFTCAQDNCYVAGPRAALKLCAGCKLHLYCSRECQKASWSSHKGFCKNTKNSDIGVNDIWFLAELSYDDIRRSLPALVEKPQLLQVPLQERGFIVSFSRDGNGRDTGEFQILNENPCRTRSSFVPIATPSLGCPSHPRTTKADWKACIHKALVLQVAVGDQTRDFIFSIPFTKNALRGRECTCRLFDFHY